MPVTLRFDGLEELRAAFRNLPAELTGEAAHIIEGEANAAATEIKRGYHVRTGHLRDHLTVTHFEKGRFSAGAIVKNTAPHAWLYDNGSQARHWASGKSTGAMWGRTPPTHLFVRTMIKHRRVMWGKLKELLVRHGLVVSGDA
jgi:hypothetical protein